MRQHHNIKGTYKRNGQAALVIILVTAVAITLVVSTIGRTVSDVVTSNQTLYASYALNAAESGVEKALMEITLDPTDTDPDCKTNSPCTLSYYEPNNDDVKQSNAIYWYDFINFPTSSDISYSLGSVPLGDYRTVWTTDNHDDPFSGTFYTGTYEIHVSASTSDTKVEFLYVYGCDGSDIQSLREVKTFSGSETYPIDTSSYSNCLAYTQIRPLDNDIDAMVIQNYTIPFSPQGVLIDSYGLVKGSGSGNQAITRRVKHILFYPDPDIFFTFAIYAGEEIK